MPGYSEKLRISIGEAAGAEVLDLDGRFGESINISARQRWFCRENSFCMDDNLPRERWPAEKVMALYRCRWQIELLFKELKSHNRLKAFAT